MSLREVVQLGGASSQLGAQQQEWGTLRQVIRHTCPPCMAQGRMCALSTLMMEGVTAWNCGPCYPIGHLPWPGSPLTASLADSSDLGPGPGWEGGKLSHHHCVAGSLHFQQQGCWGSRGTLVGIVCFCFWAEAHGVEPHWPAWAALALSVLGRGAPDG